MDTRIEALIERIQALETELEVEFARRAAEIGLTFQGKRVAFEQEVVARQRELKKKLFRYLAEARPLTVLTAPFIYALILPVALLDLMVTLYQLICFPAYGVPKVRRADYLIFDRGRLAYLNLIERLNCAYCSYANGVFAYAREVAGRTEQYWCPIKHARRVLGAHAYYANFIDFGDAEAYRAELESLRAKLAALPGP